MKSLSKSAFSPVTDAINEAWKYSFAMVEYTGLLSFSYIKRGGSVVYDPLLSITTPVWNITDKTLSKSAGEVGKVYDFMAQAIGKVNKIIPVPGRRLRRMEETLMRMEEILAKIEKHGIMVAGQSHTAKAKQELPEDKKMVLQTILQDNIELKETE